MNYIIMVNSNHIVCGKCGQKVFPYCTNSECIKWRESIAQQTIRDCFAIIGGLGENLLKRNSVGTKLDYQEIKKVQQRIDKLDKERNWNSLVEADIKELQKSCQDLIEEYISPKDRHLVDNKGRVSINRICCRPGDIKKDDSDYYYCDWCWEGESVRFIQSLRSYLLGEFNKTILNQANNSFDFSNSSNHRKLLNNQFANQEEMKQVYQELEKEISSSLRKPNTPIRERERERERERANLPKPSDSSLNSNPSTNNSRKSPLKNPLIIGGIVLSAFALIGLMLFFINKSKKSYE